MSGVAAPAIAAQCSSGWTGTINYSRTQALSDNKTVDRVSRKGTETTNFNLAYNYGASIAVRAEGGAGLSAGRANIAMTSSSTETRSAQDQDVCPLTKQRHEVSGSFVDKSETRGSGNGLEADVHVGVNDDGTYTVSIGLPEIEGVLSGSSSASYSGQCTPRKGSNRSIPETPIKIDGERFSTDGDERFSPSDPNRLSGSFSKTWQNVTQTLSWNLRRCGPTLRLVDLRFEDMRFPRWNDWQEITEQRGTIDGNRVRVTAVVANDGGEEEAPTLKFKETYKGDKWDGAKPDSSITELSVVIPAGEQREVTFDWDSSGYAWYDDGRPRLVQRIRAELEDRGKKVDEQTKNLKVAPRPLVLVHGLWSNWRAWETWQNILTTSHSYDWKAFPVGEKPEHGRMSTGEEVGSFGPTYTIAQNAFELAKTVEHAQAERNAWHVDLVAHSMGGLISRRYIHAMMPGYADGKPQITRLVMLGTPNMGSPCADVLSATLDFLDKPMEALRELRTDVVAKFNAEHGERKGVEFSVLAGNILPTMCKTVGWNDGVVTVPSARWTIADAVEDKVLHTDMTGTPPFSSFVKPRLAKGPKAQRATGGGSGAASGGRLMLIGDDETPATASDKPDFVKLVKLAPRAMVELEIPVSEGRQLGVNLLAASVVSATLIDQTGVVVGSNLTQTPQASQPFRSIVVDRPVAKGVWRLKVENTSDTEREAVVSTWSAR
ncbi:alpha/beta fold hydrolase [Novosphingobium sp. JCM 18896]|nr:alpha/beta fold hydrolase [Novosphingobium sp. JCM 18896]